MAFDKQNRVAQRLMADDLKGAIKSLQVITEFENGKHKRTVYKVYLKWDDPELGGVAVIPVIAVGNVMREELGLRGVRVCDNMLIVEDKGIEYRLGYAEE